MTTPTTSIADHSIDERVLVLLDEEIAPLIAYNSAVGADGIAAFDGNLRVRLHFRIQVVKSLSITKLATERDHYLSRRLKEVSSSQDLDNVITDILTQTENLPRTDHISASLSRGGHHAPVPPRAADAPHTILPIERILPTLQTFRP
jgi:hypothetical protein